MTSTLQVPLQPLVGVPGTEAHASKGGYYYQDLVTALAWTKLAVGEDLHIEIAEDYAVASATYAEITQVKHVGNPLTLTQAVAYLERFLQMVEDNRGRNLSFVYLTTSDIGKEKDAQHRPGGKPGILYWQEVQAGGDPGPLIEVLKKLAPAGGKLEAFLKGKSQAEIVCELVQKVAWAARALDIDAVRLELQERVATIAFEEAGVQKTAGRRLWSVVADAVMRASREPEELARIITHASLRKLIRDESTVVLPRDQYSQLLDQAALVENLPIAPVNDEIQRRLDQLRRSRFLQEADPIHAATALGRDVADGGMYQIGDRQLRASTLCWCARLLLDHQDELARMLLDNAARLGPPPEHNHVTALIRASQDKDAARQLLANDHSNAAETIRYAIARKGSVEEGLHWLTAAALAPSQLDEGGQALVLMDLLRSGLWEFAIEWLGRIPESSYSNFPFLLWAGAHTLVAWSTVDGARQVVLGGPPVLDELHLRDDPPAIKARRKAAEYFRRFHSIALVWGLQETAKQSLEYALGLMLDDQQTRTAAIAEVARLWKDSDENSGWLPLALRAGIDLDKAKLVAALDARGLRYGSLNYDDARARLALLFHTRPDTWLVNWPTICHNISAHFTAAFLQNIHVQGLIQAKRFEDARAALTEATDIPEQARKRLELELEQPDSGTLEHLRQAAEENADPASLHNLCVALFKSGDIAGASLYAFKLFEQTHEHHNADEYLNLLALEGRWSDILEFLRANEFLLEQSKRLGQWYVDALIRHGLWAEARSAADTYDVLGKSRSDFDLYLSISSGEWDKVGFLLEQANSDSDSDPAELVRFANIATNLGNIGLAKQLIRRAVAKSDSDPTICWSAYITAVQGNWEREPEVRSWFQTAFENAGAEGSPLRKAELSDLLAMAPKWRERDDALNKALASGDMFLALAAQQVNRPLASWMVGTAISNENEKDFRRISPIPALAGIQRLPANQPSTVVLDATAMLTLARLGVLKNTLEMFETIHIPHSTGVWLFTEASRVRFHQPGQITDAKLLLHAIARTELNTTEASLAYSKPLADEIGVDLAQLITACDADRAAGKQAFVVRPSPLHRVGSLLEELADIGNNNVLLRSTLEIARSLHHYGAISDVRFEEIYEYLHLHDQGWPGEAPIPRGARLYLDDLAVTYLQYVGLLSPLADAGFELLIHPAVRDHAVALSSMEDSGEKVVEVVEQIRDFIVDGQSRGVVRVLPLVPTKREETDERRPVEVTASVMLEQLFQHASGIEAVISDDRSMNRYQTFNYPNGNTASIYSSIEVLGWMRDKGLVNEKTHLKCLTTLRLSGYLFVPLGDFELRSALASSGVHNGELFESVAARAIRENILLARASGFLRLPLEMHWYTDHVANIAKAVSELWSEGTAIDVRIKSSWLLELMQFDGFADRIPFSGDNRQWVGIEALSFVRVLMNPDVPDEHRSAYNQWLEDSFLSDMSHGRPRVFALLCDVVRANISNVATSLLDNKSEGELEGFPRAALKAEIGKQFINNLPRSVRDEILEDDTLFEKLGLKRSTTISVGIEGSPSFSAEELYAAAAMVYASGSVACINDGSGSTWSMEVRGDGLVYCTDETGQRSFLVSHSPLVSPITSARLGYLAKFAAETGVPKEHVATWFDEVSSKPLSASRVAILERDFRNTPSWRTNHIRRLLVDGHVSVQDLAPTAISYYERLIPAWDNQTDLSSYVGALRSAQGSTEDPLEKLVWSAHPATVPTIAIQKMPVEALRARIPPLLEKIDLWSLAGLLEALSSRPDAFTELLDTIRLSVDRFTTLMSDEVRLGLTSALFALVDSTLNGSGAFGDLPVFWRRLASIAQAALVERAVLDSSVDVPSFVNWADEAFPLFQSTTLADLAREPRWSGFMASAHQLRHELIGRVVHALGMRRDDIQDEALQQAVFGESESSLLSRSNIFFGGLPGPLEGALTLTQPLQAELVSLLAASLSDEDQPLFRRVLAAAQLANMGRLPASEIKALESAVKTLDRQDVAKVGEEYLPTFCMRLSLVAAATRNEELTAAIKQLLLGQPAIQLPLRFISAVITCAAEVDEGKWAAEVGRVTDLCTRMVTNRQEAEHMLFTLRAMRNVRADLKPSVAGSYARLEALKDRF